MKFSLSWLKEYLDTDASVDEIAQKLTAMGLEVESVENPFDALKDFTVCEVLSAQKHPDADKLKVCNVLTDEGEKQIVCGAPNARAGIKAVLAKSGHIIPTNGMKLKPTKIRGVESNGMMCSARELGLGDDHNGIIEAPDDFQLGDIYAEKIGLNDPIIEIAITPNRGDCLGVNGIARDLAAAGLGTYKEPNIKNIDGSFTADNIMNVEIDESAKNNCPVFMGRIIRNVSNCESPDWLKRKLLSVDINPKSLLVDVTNYMSYALGRPMHVFDLDKLKGNKLTVRSAHDGEKMLGLDEVEHNLEHGMTVIADEAGVVSIAGIMGGMESGCTLDTKNVFIESALFDAINIAITGRKLGIISDSRYRFERGVDANMIHPAIELATEIILENCGGEASDVIVKGEIPNDKKVIDFAYDLIQKRTGVNIPNDKAKDYLLRLGFKVINDDGDRIKVEVPSWRHDITIKEDLVEEIIRLHGYENIPVTPLPTEKADNDFESYKGAKQKHKRMSIARRVLASSGLHEAMTWSFLSKDDAELFRGDSKIEELEIENPISSDLSIMRPSILPNLINACARNWARGIKNVNLFEVGSIYKTPEQDGHKTVISAIRTGKNTERNWRESSRDVDVYDIKADLLKLMHEFGIKNNNFQIENGGCPDYYHPGRCAVIKQGPKNILGYMGEIHPKTLKTMGVKFPVVALELILENLPQQKNGNSKRSPLKVSPYQMVERDFAFILEKDVPASKLLTLVQKVDKELIKDVCIFDIYEGDKLEEGKKSLAISVKMQSMEGTLSDEQIQKISDSIITNVEKQLGGNLRDQ